jgi:hypothetical protein
MSDSWQPPDEAGWQGHRKQVQGALDAPGIQPCDKRRFFHFYSLLGISKIISK